jgi:hypothetical protein
MTKKNQQQTGFTVIHDSEQVQKNRLLKKFIRKNFRIKS